MQDWNRDPERDKKLARRPLYGMLLMLLITLVLTFGLTGFMFLFVWVVRDSDTTDTSWVAAGAILGLVLVLVLGIGSMALLLYVMRWSMEKQRQDLHRDTQVLQHTLPQLVSASETQAAKDIYSGKTYAKLLLLFPVYMIVAGILSWAIRSGVERLWPDAPRWVSSIMFFALIFGGAFAIRGTVARRRERQDGEKAPALRTSLGRVIGRLFFFAFIMLPLFGLLPLLKHIHPLAMVPLMLILPLLGLFLLMMVYLLVPMLWVLAALKRADYRGAIRRSQWLEQFHVFSGAFLNLRGFALFLAGDYEQAQQVLQESIRATRRQVAAGGADGLDNIGCALAAQGKYDEATRMFEGAMEISPQHVGAYNDLAQVYLFQGIEPQRVLELTERALEHYQASFSTRWLERYQFGIIWSSRAWALALLGQHSEAAQALEQAFAGTDRNFVPELAGVHFRAGHTELLRGKRAKAVEHWEQARQLDPQGHYGGLAAQALRDLET